MGDYNDSETVIGHGKELAYSDTENGTYTPIPGTIEVNLPERELGESEILNDDSEHYHKDYLPSVFDPGTISFTYQYGKTAFAEVEALFQLASATATRASATKWWRITSPDGSTSKVRGFLKSHNLPMEQEDAVVVEAEIRCRGKMTFTPASVS